MKKKLKISVVIPTCNRPALLMNCLRALAQQRFDSDQFEVVVVSDGPDPASKKVVISWMATHLLQLKYLSLKQQSGPAAARNTGWKKAAGQLIAFTDDDCQPDPEWLTRLWNNHQQDEELVAYTGKVIVPVTDPSQATDHAMNTAHLSEAAFVTANCACTRAALELVGGFDERYPMAWREDSDLEFNLISRDIPIRYLSLASVVHPVRPVPWGNSLKDQRKGIFNALLYRKFPSLYKTRIRQSPPLFYYLMILTLVGGIVSLAYGWVNTAKGFLFTWTFMWLYFSYKRLENSSRSLSHILEMLYTSALIPLLSVYWHFYGLIRYRTFFL